MDIEGFVRARIDDYDYDELAEILAVRIREYKKISEENSVEMAKAVIDEVSTTLKLQESDDEFLKEIAGVNKARRMYLWVKWELDPVEQATFSYTEK